MRRIIQKMKVKQILEKLVRINYSEITIVFLYLIINLKLNILYMPQWHSGIAIFLNMKLCFSQGFPIKTSLCNQGDPRRGITIFTNFLQPYMIKALLEPVRAQERHYRVIQYFLYCYCISISTHQMGEYQRLLLMQLHHISYQLPHLYHFP